MTTLPSENFAAEIPAVSVVIPIYKVERYLTQCVESVLMQTMRDLEVILVDDGSPDSCPQIADDFAALDPRVTVIHQTNQGLSGARNAGLRRAKGRLVVFLDSDDFWEGEDSLARCVSVFEERPDLDVLFFDALLYYESTGERVFGEVAWERQRVAGASHAEVLRYMIECGDVRPSACTKVIRRKFLIANGLDFKRGIYSEDFEWFLRLITHPGKYDYLPLRFYMYRQFRPGSISNTVGRQNVDDILDTVLMASRRIFAADAPRGFKRDYLSYCSYLYTMSLALWPRLAPRDYEDVRAHIQEAQFLLAYDGYRNSKSIGRLIRIIGLEATARLLHTYLSLRALRNRSR